MRFLTIPVFAAMPDANYDDALGCYAELNDVRLRAGFDEQFTEVGQAGDATASLRELLQ